jgi:antidote-toxin recognition MazE-like antitoxin
MKRKSKASKSKVRPAQLRARTVARKASRAATPGAKRSRSGTPMSGAKTARTSPAHTSPTRPKSSRDKVRAYRERMRRRGMKLIQIWVPDPKSPHFFAEARRQAKLIAESPYEKDDQAFIDSVTDWDW